MVFVATALFALLQAGLSAAAGILGAMLQQRIYISVALLLRAGLSALLVASLLLLNTVMSLTDPTVNINSRDTISILFTLLVGFFVVADGGIVLAADFLRPYQPSTFRIFLFGVGSLIAVAVFVWLILEALRRSEVRAVSLRAKPAPQRFRLRHLLRPLHFDAETVRHQIQVLRAQHKQLRSGFVLVVLSAPITIIMLGTPHWVYIDKNTFPFLLLPIAGAVLISLPICLRTLMIANTSFNRCPPGKPRQTGPFIMGLWWAVVRWCWPAHAISAVMRLGLVYGIAQFFHSSPVLYNIWSSTRDFPDILMPFYHQSYAGPWVPYPVVFPRPIQFVAAGVTLAMVGVGETFLLSALGLLSATLFRRRRIIELGVAWLLSLGLAWLSFGGLLALRSAIQYGGLTYSILDPWGAGVPADGYREVIRALESIEVALTVPFDGGVLATANILRITPFQIRLWYGLRAVFNVALGVGILAIFTALALRVTYHRFKRISADLL